MHPYFETALVEGTPWLFATVIEAIPVTVQYFIKAPDEWPIALRQRLTNHFVGLELGRRFAIEAAAELAGLAGMLVELPSADIRERQLLMWTRAERKVRPNSWKAALYDALATNEWYLNGGFSNGV